MTALQRLHSTLRVGLTLRVVSNTYRPVIDGTTRTVTVPGKTRYLYRQDDGMSGRSPLPTRTSEVEWLDETTVRYKIGRGDHTVTLQILLTANPYTDCPATVALETGTVIPCHLLTAHVGPHCSFENTLPRTDGWEYHFSPAGRHDVA